MLKIYFGHPMNTYGTPLEARLLAEIGSAFPRFASRTRTSRGIKKVAGDGRPRRESHGVFF